MGWIRYLGSGKKKIIPDPGSRGKKAPDPGSGSATLGFLDQCSICRLQAFRFFGWHSKYGIVYND
jgi:hypothetical protein